MHAFIHSYRTTFLLQSYIMLTTWFTQRGLLLYACNLCTGTGRFQAVWRDTTGKMSTCWNNAFGGVEAPKVFTEQIMYKAAEIIDKVFHSPVVITKSDLCML